MLRFHLHAEDEDYVIANSKQITEHLQKALLLFVAELQEDERKRKTPIGKGISGDASIETANAQERLRLEHERNFGTEVERQQKLKEIQENLTRNTMVQPKRGELWRRH